jgi:hypothetical protein
MSIRRRAKSRSVVTRLCGGTLSSRPKAVSRGRGLIDVLAAGRDQSVWHLAHAVGGWAKWKSIGGEVG